MSMFKTLILLDTIRSALKSTPRKFKGVWDYHHNLHSQIWQNRLLESILDQKIAISSEKTYLRFNQFWREAATTWW